VRWLVPISTPIVCRLVAFGDQTSAWWYYGRLRPTTATRFNVQEVAVRPDVRLEVFHDVIAVWSKAGPNTLAGPAEFRELVGVTLGAYALISGVALDWTAEGWIEATNATFAGTIIGTFVDPRGHDPMLSVRARRSVDMRRACRLAVRAQRYPGYRLALRDIHSALSVGGDDAFVFAYRAIEDLVRAVSGRRGELRASDWAALHTRLGTSKSAFVTRIAPLQEARHAAAHGDDSDADLVAARADRTNRLELARQIVGETASRESLLQFELAQLRPLK
jgi:hypothetical protein